jgi:hypothetical protein
MNAGIVEKASGKEAESLQFRRFGRSLAPACCVVRRLH